MKAHLPVTNQCPSQMFQKELCKLPSHLLSVRCWGELALGMRWLSQWAGIPQVMVAALSWQVMQDARPA